jgi:hypothetical protein
LRPLEEVSGEGVKVCVWAVVSQEEAWRVVGSLVIHTYTNRRTPSIIVLQSAHIHTYIHTHIRQQEDTKGTPSIIMLQSAHSASTLIDSYAPALDEFPIIELPFTSDDNVYDPLGCVSFNMIIYMIYIFNFQLIFTLKHVLNRYSFSCSVSYTGFH